MPTRIEEARAEIVAVVEGQLLFQGDGELAAPRAAAWTATWMSDYCPCLGDVTPQDYIERHEDGATEVMSVVLSMIHGVYR